MSVTIEGKQYSGKGQSVNISEGYLDFYNAAPIQSVRHEIEQHIIAEVRPVQGYGEYTHVITFEDVLWGILVTQK